MDVQTFHLNFFFFFFGKRLKHRVSRSSHRRNKGKLYEWHSIQVTQLSNPSWWMGLERVWSVPACLPRLLQLFSISNRCLPGRWSRAPSPWWAGTEPQLLLCVLTSTCSWASLTLHRSMDLVRMQWDIGVLFGVVRILKPTHTLNYSNCKKKKKKSTPAESLLCLSSYYKHLVSQLCDINTIIIPILQRRKLRHNLKKLPKGGDVNPK